MDDDELRIYRIAMVGPHGAGKTSILNCLQSGCLDENEKPTIGANFITHKIQIGDEFVELQIWDTAGQDKYKSLGSSYYRDAYCVIAVYDLTEPDSIKSMDEYIQDYLEVVQINNPLVAVVGNKLDLFDQLPDGQGESLGKKYTQDNQYPFFLTSAKTGAGINQVFEYVSKTLMDNAVPPETVPESIIASPEKKKQCC